MIHQWKCKIKRVLSLKGAKTSGCCGIKAKIKAQPGSVASERLWVYIFHPPLPSSIQYLQKDN